ncbi:MAG: VWA domain-containing protein [Cocleimonas sp.]|nr:VWA domain-containing protein [Cocleimonas sp.]
MLNYLDWRQPLWLLLALQPLLLWLFLRWKNNKASNSFADKHLLPWVQVTQQKSLMQKVFSRNSAYWLAIILLAIAMAGPRTALESADSKQASALDIMLVIDVSASMKATDIQPSRLQRASQELHELLTLTKRDDVRFGSIVYAARPHLFVPMTNDHNALKFYLKDLNKLVLPTKGSEASAALLMAAKALQKSGGEAHQEKAILWISDGDIDQTTDQAKIESTLNNLRQQKISTHILGLGTTEGAAIPLSQGGWLQHNGQGIITKSNLKLLAQFAKIGGGKFSEVYADESEWQTLYTQGLLKTVASNAKPDPKDENQQWQEYYQWFLFPALLLLLLSLVPFKLNAPQTNTVTAILALIFVGSLLSPYSKAYADNIFSASLQSSIEDYKNQEYALATSGFISAILQANTRSERAMAMHNLGNNYFQQGDYQNAAQLFEDALRYAPKQTQSQHNLTLTKELNALLEKRRRRGIAGRANQGLGQREQNNPNQLVTSLDNITPELVESVLPELPKEKLDSLLSKGLAHLKMMDGPNAEKHRVQQRNVEQARISLLRDQDDSLQMWKRLFEIEEGFPAKLKEPQIVPGQQPW